MALMLKIIIGCLVAIALVAICCVAAFFIFLKHLAKACRDDMSVPFAIHLHEDLSADWVSHKNATPFIEEFQALGFVQGTAYTVEEMPQLKCLSFFHERFVGVLYEIDKQGFYFDIVHMRSESDGLTVTTMPHAGDFQSPPGKEKISMTNVSVDGKIL